MPVITIASPDRLSISMFIGFMRTCTGSQYLMGAAHSLMTDEAVNLFIDDLLKKGDKILISYYAKKQINKDPVTVIPEKILNVSNLVIWMELYSTDWKIVKDPDNIASQFQGRWKMNIEKLGGNRKEG